MKINIILFPDFETLDICGPIEILARVPGHELHYYSKDGGMIRSAQGMEIKTDSVEHADKQGIFVIPGGRGTRPLVENKDFLEKMKPYAAEAPYCLSICTGAALLAMMHILDGKCATSNKKAFSWVESLSENVNWIRHSRWEKDGKVYTSSGVSAGMDMTLGFISDVYGRQTAEQIACDIEYLWNDDSTVDPFAN